jgi:hypothetical protein
LKSPAAYPPQLIAPTPSRGCANNSPNRSQALPRSSSTRSCFSTSAPPRSRTCKRY